MENRTLRIVISKDEDMFVAQCLEHDICVQGADMTQLQDRFAATLLAESGAGNLDAIPPAPEVFHAMWEAGMALDGRLENTDMRLAA
jgi:hypothetical protein